MPRSVAAVKECLKDLRTYIDKVNRKLKIPSDYESSPYRLMGRLQQCIPAFLTYPEALDLLIEFIPEIESFRGKGSQTMNGKLPQILHTTLFEYAYKNPVSPRTKDSYPEATALPALKKIARLALPRAVGDEKKLRSQRAAEFRKNYWKLLTDLANSFLMPEAVQAAKNVTANGKRSVTEREGALRFLLTHQALLRATEGEEEDTEIKALVATLRDAPPSEDILFLILNHGVESGTISEMTALIELEDWREAHDE
jgi:hypothetical protein